MAKRASSADTLSPYQAIQKLADYFYRNGYIRRLDPQRRKDEGQLYKKGNEIRFVADTRRELAEIRRLLVRAGFTPGTPFAKSRQWRQPVYGVEQVARFLELIAAYQPEPLPQK